MTANIEISRSMLRAYRDAMLMWDGVWKTPGLRSI